MESVLEREVFTDGIVPKTALEQVNHVVLRVQAAKHFEPSQVAHVVLLVLAKVDGLDDGRTFELEYEVLGRAVGLGRPPRPLVPRVVHFDVLGRVGRREARVRED